MPKTIALIVVAMGLFMGNAHNAQADNCGVPIGEFTYVPIPPNTPDNIRAFHGKWGEAKWDNVLCHVLIVRDITAAGWAGVIYASGGPNSWGLSPWTWRGSGQIEGNTLKITSPMGDKLTYILRDGKLYGLFDGTARYGGRPTSAVLPKSQ